MTSKTSPRPPTGTYKSPKLEEIRADAEARYEYNPATGHFWWRQFPRTGRAKAGVPAGWISKNGYRLLKLGSGPYLAHRIAWLLTYGSFPAMLDHKNCIKDDNRISNLRIATPIQNGANRPKQSNNTSGLKGAYFCKDTGKWLASIKHNQKQYNLGFFISREEAYAVYCKKARELFGEYWHE